MKNFTEIYQNLSGKTATIIPRAARSSRGKYSLGIVCSEKNGKRLTLTASLSEALTLEDKLFITAYADDGIIILSPCAINEYSVETALKGEEGKGGKISYNAGLVRFIIDAFKLDYKGIVSKTFHNFTFNNDPNNPMAILTFPKVSDTADVGDEPEANDESCPET